MPEKRVLVVEDDKIGMMLVRDLLRMRGYLVSEAADAVAGMELARTERPDLIVMDVGLPRMDGLTATRLLKADPATAPIPVLALTAHAMPGDEDSTLAAGCARYLAKPFDVHVFLDVVAELTGGTS